MRTLFPSYLGTAVQKEPTFNTRLGKSCPDPMQTPIYWWRRNGKCSCYIMLGLGCVTPYCSAHVKYVSNELGCAKFGRDRHKPTVHAAQALQCGKRFWLHQLLEIQKSGVSVDILFTVQPRPSNGTFNIIMFNFYAISKYVCWVWWCSWPFGQASCGSWARAGCR